MDATGRWLPDFVEDWISSSKSATRTATWYSDSSFPVEALAAGACMRSASLVVDSARSIPEDQTNAAVLWDIRVLPRLRGCGAGSALMAAVERCAAKRGFHQLVVETQNVNVPACRFYLRRGFTLGAIHRFAYPSLPDEIQLLWHKLIAS